MSKIDKKTAKEFIKKGVFIVDYCIAHNAGGINIKKVYDEFKDPSCAYKSYNEGVHYIEELDDDTYKSHLTFPEYNNGGDDPGDVIIDRDIIRTVKKLENGGYMFRLSAFAISHLLALDSSQTFRIPRIEGSVAIEFTKDQKIKYISFNELYNGSYRIVAPINPNEKCYVDDMENQYKEKQNPNTLHL